MNVGELILGVRSLGPDPCAVVGPPIAPNPQQGGANPQGFPLNTTVFLVATVLTAYGESSPSQEVSLALTGGNNTISLQITYPPGTTSLRVYYGFVAGQESGYEQYDLPLIDFATGLPSSGSPVTVLVTGIPDAPGFPPASPSSFLPDSDGGFVSAALMYRWLNESLKAAARATGGIQDVCGVASISGQRRYVVPRQWLKFTQCFYDGWELNLGNKAETFRNRNLTASIAVSLMVDAQSDTTRIELYWTPSRTGGVAISALPVGPNDTTIPINSSTGWLLGDGFAMLRGFTGGQANLTNVSINSGFVSAISASPPPPDLIVGASVLLTAPALFTPTIFTVASVSGSNILFNDRVSQPDQTTTTASLSVLEATIEGEIISYSANDGFNVSGLIRQWSGTRASDSVAAPGVIKELNIELNGYRMPATYSPGDSARPLDCPPGWEPFLKDYMLGLFRDAEQERQEAEALKSGAIKGLTEWAKSNKPVAGPRQCRMYGDTGMRGLFPAGHGIIIP